MSPGASGLAFAHRPIRRSLAGLLVFLLPLAGCRTWVEVDRAAAARDSATYGELRVHRVEGPSLVLYEARFLEDSLIGLDRPSALHEARGRAVARDGIRKAEHRRIDPLTTTLVLIPTAAAMVFVGPLVLCSQTDCLAQAGF